MTAPVHHLPADTVAGYANGEAAEAEALLVATHLALCPTCRSEVSRLEALGGVALETLEPAPALDLDAMLARLDEPEPAPTVAPRPRVAPTGQLATLPEPLRSYVGSFDGLPWKTKIPGVRTADLGLSLGEVPVRLSVLKPGLKLPRHTHAGRELTLVLQGGFENGHGHYVRGDVEVGLPEQVHAMVIDPGDPCIALSVNEGSLEPVDLLGKLVSKFVSF